MATRLPPITLTYLLQDHKVSVDTLYERDGAIATIAKHLLGIVPVTGEYLEIWPPANRIYCIVVPCFLDLPAFMLSTSAHKELVSLGMYAASLTSCCPYSSAYTCTFALRRGVNPDKLRIQAVCTRHGDASALYTDEEKTVIDVSERLAIYPCKVTNDDRRKLREVAGSPETAEAIVLGTSMMGFLDKSMDGLGAPLEVNVFRETRDILGDTWSPGATNGQLVNPDVHTPGSLPPMDSQTTYAAMMEEGPGAASYVAKVMADIPTNADEATTFLIERYGYGFPVLKSMHLNRPMTAVACMVHECFNPETSVIGMKTKLGVAQVFAAINESKPVQEAVDAIAKHFGVAQDFLDLVKELGSEGDAIRAAKRLFATNEGTRMQALLIIGHATSFAPTRVDEDLVMLCEDAKLTPPSIVEAVTVVSVMQMLHRISMYYIDDEVETP